MVNLTAESILEFSNSLSDFVFRKKFYEINRIDNFNSLVTNLNHSISQRNILAEQTIKLNDAILAKFLILMMESEERNRQTSCNFNMFRNFKIGETLHSYLLSNILDPNSEHGQGSLFLHSFLKKIGIECPEDGPWIVTAEKGRIDILIKRNYPHSVVVIENKSNFALDQNNQLYRYWYREIYYPNKEKEIDYTPMHPEKYQIIYLTPTDGKQPNQNTISIPESWSVLFPALPKVMPLQPLLWTFDKNIRDWLNESMKLIHQENYRFKEYINQYIEL